MSAPNNPNRRRDNNPAPTPPRTPATMPGRASFADTFIEAEQIKLFLKVFMWGTYGTRKTPTALQFPRPVAIDTHGGVRPYMGRTKEKFRLAQAPTYEAVIAAIDAAAPAAGIEFDTIILDDVSTILDSLRARYLTAARKGYLGRGDHSRINLQMKDIYSRLNALNCHVVVIGREAALYSETSGDNDNARQIGVKAATDYSAPYAADLIIHMTGNGGGIIERIRGLIISEIGTQLNNVTWDDVFAPIAESLATGDDPTNIGTQIGANLFMANWRGQGLNNQQILKALGVTGLKAWKGNRNQADEAVAAYLEANKPADKSMPPVWNFEAVKKVALRLFNHEQHLRNTISKLAKANVINNSSSTSDVISALKEYKARNPAKDIEESGDGSEYVTGEDLGFGGV